MGCLMLAAQWDGLAQWHAASAEMQRVIAAVPAFADSIPPQAYRLLLLPDHVGMAPFARNAQGGIVMRPLQPVDYLDRMAGMTSDGFEGWTQHITGATIASLKGIPRFDPANFEGLYCWNPTRGSIVKLTSGE